MPEANDISPRKYRRAEYKRAVSLFLDNETVLKGLTNDVSQHSISFFLSFKNCPDFFAKIANKDHAKSLTLSDIRRKLIGEVTLLAIDDKELPDPIDVRIMRIERSWKKDFDVFVGGVFCNVTEFTTKKLEQICPGLRRVSSAPTQPAYVSSQMLDFCNEMQTNGAAVLEYTYTNHYDHVRIHRDLMAEIVKTYGFSESEVYSIKLMVDELLMNAMLYGSIDKGRDKTLLKILISHGRVYVLVRDHAGREFENYVRDKKDLKKVDAGGLALVERFSKDWQIETHKNEYTEVSFFVISENAEQALKK